MQPNLEKLTREEAIELLCESIIQDLHNENCEFCSYDELNKIQEWTSEICIAECSQYSSVSAHYFVTDEEIEEAGDDLANVDWKISHYSIQW